MVGSTTLVASQSTIDSFTQRTADAATFVFGTTSKPEVDDFAYEGDHETNSQNVTARAAAVETLTDHVICAITVQSQYTCDAEDTMLE